MNILAVAAHPDDIEEMCFGTLCKYRARGDSIYIVLSTSGNIGSNVCTTKDEIAAIREKEASEAARLLDAQIRFLRNDDELLEDTPQTRMEFLDALRWADPDVILTHYLHDPSPDHHMTAQLILSVLQVVGSNLMKTLTSPIRKNPSVFYFDTPGGLYFQPEIYVNISEHIETKMNAIACHRSQREWMEHFLPDDYLDSMRLQSRFRGYQYGCQYAEGFIPFRILGFVADGHLLP